MVSNVTKAGNPLFPNSVVSNDIDFIIDTDPDVFTNLTYIGQEDKEMPDSRSDNLFDVNTFVFEATFSDGYVVEIWCHSSFNSRAGAQEYAEKLCPRLGKLPRIHRNMLDHVVIHTGDATAFAETEGHFFVLYSDNMDDRLSTHDLEETVFHESVHASIQSIYESDAVWINAQSADPSFVTDYAQSRPSLEDMPESALFAYTFITHPGRLSKEIENWLSENIPNRLEFFRTIYPNSPSDVRTVTNEFIHAYPNPTNGKLTIMLEDKDIDSRINIFSITGILLKSQKTKQGRNEIDLGELSDGVYLLSTSDEKTLRITKH